MIADLSSRHRSVETYLRVVTSVLQDCDPAAVLRVAERLQRTRDVRGTIYLAGNGGSAATASHFANDLSKATRLRDSHPMRVVSLSDQLSWLTALANDEGYERVFSGQLENLAVAGDVLVVFSASGNSPNLVAAVQTARARGVETIAMLGFDGGVLKSMVDDYIWLPTPRGAYGPVEDVHLVLCHLLTTCLAIPVTTGNPSAGIAVAFDHDVV